MEIRKLNTLRGIAATIVLVSHFSNSTGWLGKLLGYGAGQIGVMVFFILSGFLMSYLYLGQDFKKENVINYLAARGARVLPLFLLVVLLSYFFSSLDLSSIIFYDIPNYKYLASHLSFMYGTSVLWTIAPEVQFYVLFLLIWKLSERVNLNRRILLVVMAIILLSVFAHSNYKGAINGYPYHFNIIKSLPYFLSGVLFGWLYRHVAIANKYRSGWYSLSLLALLLLYPNIMSAISGYGHGMWYDIRVLLVVSFVFCCVLFLVPDDNFFLCNSIGDFLGKVSFSLYLWHLPILGVVKRANIENNFVMLIAFFSISLILSWFSYHLIERKAANYLRRKYTK